MKIDFFKNFSDFESAIESKRDNLGVGANRRFFRRILLKFVKGVLGTGETGNF